MKRLVLLLLFFSLLAPTLQAQQEKTATQSVGNVNDSCPNLFSNRDRKLYDEAIALYHQKKYGEAAAVLRKVSARNPKAPDPYFYLGMIAAKQNENPGAIRRYFSKLITLCPNYPNALAHYWKGIIDYSDEHYADAVKHLTRYFDMARGQDNKEYNKVYSEASNYLHWSKFLDEVYSHPVPFELELISGVSSKNDEMLPFVTADGMEIYFLRQEKVKNYNQFYHKQYEETILNLYRSQGEGCKFDKGKPCEDLLQQHGYMGSVSLTADKRTIAYSVVEQEQGYNNCDIYVCHKEFDRWETPERLGNTVNGKRSWESQPCLSADGQWLYFASNREGGYGGTDIWRCHRQANGHWSKAENLGPTVNTAGDEKSPFIHADGHTLYFASNGWQGFGGYDEYFIDLDNVNLSCPTNMGLPVNSEQDNFGFVLSTDGATAYFAGRQPLPSGNEQGIKADATANKPWPAVGGTDIYRFNLYREARPERMRYEECHLETWNNKPDWNVTVLREGRKPMIYPIDSYGLEPTKGGLVGIVLSCEVPNIVMATAPGYMPYLLNCPPNEIPSLPIYINLDELAVGARHSLPIDLSDGLDNIEKQCLSAYASWLLENPMVHVRLEGGKNVKEAYDYMRTALHLRAERITTSTQGSGNPLTIVVTQL